MVDGPTEMRFGETWDQAVDVAKYYTFQYKFKPQSATRTGMGAVQIDHNTVCPYITTTKQDLVLNLMFGRHSVQLARMLTCL